MDSIAGCLSAFALEDAVKGVIGSNKGSRFMYRDELGHRRQAPTRRTKAPNMDLNSSQPQKQLLKDAGAGHGRSRQEVVRVKVKMTKREAERLLSKCRDGGVIGFRDLAQQIVEMPSERVHVIAGIPSAERPALYTIQEES